MDCNFLACCVQPVVRDPEHVRQLAIRAFTPSRDRPYRDRSDTRLRVER